ncbi:MAG: hypothetical protein QOJ51_3245 [Acidobacteriaceae bacterium]|nr:hypothetical protein [Acidobacteriaceae bacterium]MDT7811760.1 hypothetical protein [Acidobacteriaceae bacterium]MEA2260420.1 hypothetical protein [Acidobacteriaceae bacterium]
MLLRQWTRLLLGCNLPPWGKPSRWSLGPVGQNGNPAALRIHLHMIRKLKSGEYRLYSRKKSESTGKRRNLGTFATLAKARQHEREVQYFKKR